MLRSPRPFLCAAIAALVLGTARLATAAEATDASVWQSKDVRIAQVDTGHSNTTASAGISDSDDGGSLALKLDGTAPWSDVVLTEHVPFDLRDVVRADLAQIHNGDTTVQIACFDSSNALLDSVDIL